MSRWNCGSLRPQPVNSSASATSLQLNSPTSGELDFPGDVDWFSFSAVAGTEYTLRTRLGTLFDSDLTFYDQDATTVIGETIAEALLFWQAPATGVYFIKVWNFFSDTGSYQVEVSDVPLVDDHGNHALAATPLGTGGSVGGDIEIPGDEDWFSFSAVEGAAYVFRTELNSLPDSVLTLIDRDGRTVLSFNDDEIGGGRASRIEWTAPESDTFYLVVGGYFDETGTYRLRVGLDGFDAEVLGRHVFYNGSSFDTSGPAANRADDLSIATDKTALLPGQSATFANYTSFPGGINGVMIDVAGWPGADDVDASLFEFRTGNNSDPSTWPLAPSPASITLRRGDGAAGSDRISFIWPDGAIVNTWLQVAVNAGRDTGLLWGDVFYFGNAVGDTGAGNPQGVVLIDSVDRAGVRANLQDTALIDNIFDFDRDGHVDDVDRQLVRDNPMSFLTGLRRITAPLVSTTSPLAVERTARTALFENLGRSTESDRRGISIAASRRGSRSVSSRPSSPASSASSSPASSSPSSASSRRLRAAAIDRALVDRASEVIDRDALRTRRSEHRRR
ncbi:MAG: PPC domain-containing protein [Planctomycetes bacterium]|nr:PPC domain-containing protein [Planctomycetota bacterium]